jgi:hypothetical protein
MSQKSRKNGKKEKSEEKEPRLDALELSDDTKRGLVTIVLLIVAILFTLSAFGLAGIIGEYLNGFNHKLLGKLYFLLPIFLLFVATGRLRSTWKAFDAAGKLGAGLFILMLGAFIHLMMARPDGIVFGKNLKRRRLPWHADQLPLGARTGLLGRLYRSNRRRPGLCAPPLQNIA